MLTFDNGSYDACAVLLPLKNSLSNGLLPAVVLRTCLSVSFATITFHEHSAAFNELCSLVSQPLAMMKPTISDI